MEPNKSNSSLYAHIVGSSQADSLLVVYACISSRKMRIQKKKTINEKLGKKRNKVESDEKKGVVEENEIKARKMKGRIKSRMMMKMNRKNKWIYSNKSIETIFIQINTLLSISATHKSHR